MTESLILERGILTYQREMSKDRRELARLMSKQLHPSIKPFGLPCCSVKRTHVIDDESDYFSVDDRWLSKADKEKLRKREEELRAQRHASRKDRKITLDFAGRKVVEVSEFSGVLQILSCAYAHNIPEVSL